MTKVNEKTKIKETISNSDTLLDLIHVHRKFGSFEANHDINLRIKKNEFFTIVGPSGCGKTTLLKMLAGMDQPTDGDIVLKGESISALPPDKRPTCMVFQFLALFPHMSVSQNIAFPMKVRGASHDEIEKRVTELMQMVRLPESYYHKNVMKCSGGERQRVAIARAFAYDPEILLFDEPLSAIDARLRKTLEKELKELHRKSGKTFIYITHSLEEAMVMSDRIGVMCKGKLIQVGTPDDIYNRPNSRFVAEFIGDTNIFAIRVLPEGGWESSDLPDMVFKVQPHGKDLEGFIIIRPEKMIIVDENCAQIPDNVIECVLEHKFNLGSREQMELLFDKKVIQVETESGLYPNLKVGDKVKVGWNKADAVFVTE